MKIGKIETLARSVCDILRRSPNLQEASVLLEKDRNLSEKGTGLEIVVKIPTPFKSSKTSEFPAFESVSVEIRVEKNFSQSLSTPSIQATCEEIFKTLHGAKLPKSCSCSRLRISNGNPCKFSSPSPQKISATILFETQMKL